MAQKLRWKMGGLESQVDSRDGTGILVKVSIRWESAVVTKDHEAEGADVRM